MTKVFLGRERVDGTVASIDDWPSALSGERIRSVVDGGVHVWRMLRWDVELEAKLSNKGEAQAALKVANEEYTSCLSKDFLTKFLNGDNVRIESFCVSQKAKMDELDQLVYGK